MGKIYDWFDDNIGFGGLAMIIGFITVVSLIIFELVNSISVASLNKKHEHYLKSKIGDKYIIGKDTLMIMEYKDFEEMYMLSNGMFTKPENIYKSKKVK